VLGLAIGKIVIPLTPVQRAPVDEPLENYLSLQYYGNITVGNNSFPVLFDTGSHLIWLRGPNLAFSFKSGNSWTPYNHPKTSLSEKACSIQYLKGNLEGTSYQDSLTWDGSSTTIWVMEAESGVDLDYNEFNGIVGMSYGTTSDACTSNFMGSLVSSGIVEHDIFAFYLTGDTTGNDMVVGGYKEELSYVTIPLYYSDIFWMVKAGGMNYYKTDIKMIVDTGTSLILMNTVLGARMFRKRADFSDWVNTGGVSLYKTTMPCTDVFKDLHFYLGDVEMILRVEDYTVSDSGYCLLPIMPFTKQYSYQEDVLLGDVWIRKFGTVFDRTNSQVKFVSTKDVRTGVSMPSGADAYDDGTPYSYDSSPTPSPTSSPSNPGYDYPDNSSIGGGIVALIVVGALVSGLAVGACVYYACKRQRQQQINYVRV